ncbi:MAG: hypothetical protein LBM66_06340 [Bifidobacteriaceae bacterium]|jgi:hypothetical protein|nr:hypothetical protein [Bifidobacteriaceae bacterium]
MSFLSTTRSRLVAAVATAGLLALGATPALASNIHISNQGNAAKAWTSTEHSWTLHVKDIADDGHNAYGFANDTNHKLYDVYGANSSVSVYQGFNITKTQACIDVRWANDPCSSWK